MTATVYRGAFEIFGELFWDMRLSPARPTGGRVGDLAVERRFVRERWSKALAGSAWRASGQTDDPPEALAWAFDAHLTQFALHAQLSLGRSVDEGTAVGAELLKLVLAALVSQAAAS